MKASVLKKYLPALLILFTAYAGKGQYYYKDILVTAQTQMNWKILHDNHVSSVVLTSYERDGEPTAGFICRQTVSGDFSTISTFSKSADASPTNLIASYDAAGRISKTMDTSDTYQSSTSYVYDEKGRIDNISNNSTETDNHLKAAENHHWIYNEKGIPVEMIKIKDGSDTSVVKFTADEKGNITEEHAFHNGQALQTVYYYYNNDNQLTDIVRYNEKAQRLLPDYIFNYKNTALPASMLFVPSGSSEYQQWYYDYDARNLKIKETCYNKRKEMIGKVNYAYSFQ